MYGIMRCEKRGRAAVYGLQIEATRTKEDHAKGRSFVASDIDWSKTKDNIDLVHCDSWGREITRQIREAGVKERKDSIVMLDGLYTASREWFDDHSWEEWMRFFQDCLDYHDRTYGRAFSAVIHLDEAVPHMHVASVPIVDDDQGRAHLSAKIVMGGRGDYRVRQDAFYEEVSRHYGMERGELRQPGDRKKHLDVLDLKAKTAYQCLDVIHDASDRIKADADRKASKIIQEAEKRAEEIVAQAKRQGALERQLEHKLEDMGYRYER